MIFHMGYAIAVALQRGKVLPADFEGDTMHDEEVARLARATEIVADPELTAIYAERKPAELSLHLYDGRVLRERVDYCRGEPENPPTEESVVGKFRDLAYPVLGEADAGKLIDLIAGLERLTDLRGLGDPLRRCAARAAAGR
jgi:2-methylcitrate dehydratase PrpD